MSSFSDSSFDYCFNGSDSFCFEIMWNGILVDVADNYYRLIKLSSLNGYEIRSRKENKFPLSVSQMSRFSFDYFNGKFVHSMDENYQFVSFTHDTVRFYNVTDTFNWKFSLKDDGDCILSGVYGRRNDKKISSYTLPNEYTAVRPFETSFDFNVTGPKFLEMCLSDRLKGSVQ